MLETVAPRRILLYPCGMSRPLRLLVLAALAAAPLGRPAAAHAANEIYVSGEDSGEIVVVDADKGEVDARIPVGKRPRGIKLSRDGKLLYVAI
jgi:YVTN family beta-propeller protein